MSGLADRAERIVYRIAGLPVALRETFGSAGIRDDDLLQSTFADRYWHPEGLTDSLELLAGIALSPIVVLLAIVWFTWRNGSLIRERCGKTVHEQFAEQLTLYFTAGVLAPWYYIFGLHDEGYDRAATFIQRFETKRCFFPMLKPKGGSPLNNKRRFAEYSTEHGLRCVKTLIYLEGKTPERPFPDQDLFIKPATGRGGRGAERWDRIAPSTFVGPRSEQLSGSELLRRLISRSRRVPLLVQSRLLPHHSLVDLTAGALPTLRVLTCLNETGEGEVVDAVFRMSIGTNRTVDNLHAGGIAAAVDLKSGRLSRATNLGTSSRLGWLSAHPDTNAQIEARALPFWNEVQRLVVRAHGEFADRALIGWDIAILDDGPLIVEGNGNPDLDIHQRFKRFGLRNHRFARLLTHHLECRTQGQRWLGSRTEHRANGDDGSKARLGERW